MDVSQPLSAEERVKRVLMAFVADHPELAEDAKSVLADLAPAPVMSLYDVIRAIGKHYLESAEGTAAHAAIDAHEAEHAQLLASHTDAGHDVVTAGDAVPGGAE